MYLFVSLTFYSRAVSLSHKEVMDILIRLKNAPYDHGGPVKPSST